MDSQFAVPSAALNKRKQSSRAESITKRTKTDEESRRGEELLSQLERQAVGTVTESVDLHTLKKMILAFEKKLTRNQELRVKYPDQPQKFMESEVELDGEIKKLSILSTAPELYPHLVELNTHVSLVSLLAHENIDIAIDVVDVLSEMLEVNSITEAEALIFVDAFLEQHGLELLVRNLSRLTTRTAEEKEATFNILFIVESLIEVRPEIVDQVGEKTELLKFLLLKLKEKGSNAFRGKKNDDDDDGDDESNQLYCSELLSILLQNSPANRKKITELDGMEVLLLAVAQYRKQEPKHNEEKEWMHNIFDCICRLLMQKDIQRTFLVAEGIELMVRLVKSGGVARSPAIKVLDYALSNNSSACNHFVDCLGLKTLFAVFMKRGRKEKKTTSKVHDSSVQRKKDAEDEEEESFVISLICSLLKHCSGNTQGFQMSRKERLISKFEEKDFEKVDRVVEMYMKYRNKLIDIDRRMEEEGITKQMMDEDESLVLYMRRLDAGLFVLQNVAQVLAYLICGEEKEKTTSSEGEKESSESSDGGECGRVQSRALRQLAQYAVPVQQLKNILLEMADNIGDQEGDQVEGEGEGDNKEKEEKEKEKEKEISNERKEQERLRHLNQRLDQLSVSTPSSSSSSSSSSTTSTFSTFFRL